ncbi:MAG: hypothetical protein ACREHV_05085 [Rhizomicrobium sp.]
MSHTIRPASRLSQILLAFLVLGVWGLLLKPYLPFAAAKASVTERSATFDTLTVQRINVVDPDGKTRFLIANTSRFPGAIVRGREYKRSIHDTAGVLFYDSNGDETGGLALARLGTDDTANMTFDYVYQPTDGISMYRSESADGKHWEADFGISDRRPFHPGPITSSQGVPRIHLIDKDKDAALVISDAQGRPRIRIGVSASGTPQIEMSDAAGKVTYRAGK